MIVELVFLLLSAIVPFQIGMRFARRRSRWTKRRIILLAPLPMLAVAAVLYGIMFFYLFAEMRGLGGMQSDVVRQIGVWGAISALVIYPVGLGSAAAGVYLGRVRRRQDDAKQQEIFE